MIRSLVNNEMEMVHKEEVVAYFCLLAQHLSGCPKIAGLIADVSARTLWNAKRGS